MTGPFAARTFADIVNAEAQQVAAGTATGCAFTDPGCHGGLTCVRVQHGDDAPHVGKDTTGQLVQWIGPCPPPTTGGTP